MERKIYFDTGSGLNTMVNPHQSTYPQGLGFRNKEAFLQWIEGKVVLDVGSGFGLLAKSVAHYGSNARIISLNPSLANPNTIEETLRSTRDYLNINDPDILSRLNEVHDSNAIVASWEEIPLPNESVDRIVSHLAFPKYCKSLEEYRKAVSEMNRVLKANGEMRLHKPKINLIRPEGDIKTPEDVYAYMKWYITSLGLKTEELPELDKDGTVIAPLICLSVKK